MANVVQALAVMRQSVSDAADILRGIADSQEPVSAARFLAARGAWLNAVATARTAGASEDQIRMTELLALFINQDS